VPGTELEPAPRLRHAACYRVLVSYDDPLAGRAGVPHLEVLRGPLPRGRRIERLPRGSILLGRGLKCDLLFDAEGVSRKHAKITFFEDGSVTLYDLGSRNGTRVNGRPIEIHTLRDGDVIDLGSVRLRFGRDDPRYRQRPGPTGSGRNPLDRLTRREREIARWVAHGLSNAEIGAKLGISARTVGTHLSHIYQVLGVPNRTKLARCVLEHEMARTEQSPSDPDGTE